MKNSIRYFCFEIISIILLILSTINVYAASEAQKKEFINNHSEILKSIKECTNCIKKKGDIRIDFLNHITQYNNIEICFSENEIKYSDKKEIRNFAKELIRNSMNCNTEVNELLYSINKNCLMNSELEEKYINEYIKLYNKMILNIECKNYGDSIEKIFITSSIKHHEYIIELTDAFCKYSDDKETIEIAKDIKNKNSKEIKKLTNILKNLDSK